MSSSELQTPAKKVKPNDVVNHDEIIAKLKQEIAELEAEKNVKNTEYSERDLNLYRSLLDAYDAKKAEQNKEIAERKEKLLKNALISTLYREGVTSDMQPLSGIRNSRHYCSSTDPHDPATTRGHAKLFTAQYLYPALAKEFPDYELDIDEHQSLTLLSINRNTHGYLVRMVLEDATNICNRFITAALRAQKLHDDHLPIKKFHLNVTTESPLFSNFHDHIVIKDDYSNVPILVVCQEAYEIDEVSTENGMTNEILSKNLDQLMSMRLMGHPHPFGALTCFNSTRVTWLDTKVHNDIVAEHNVKGYDSHRILNIISSLTGATNTSKVDTSNFDVQASLSKTRDNEASKATAITMPHESTRNLYDTHAKSTTKSSDRTIIVSEDGFSQDKSVDLYINAIFCSLDAISQPQRIIRWEENEEIVVHDIVGMTKDTHVWCKIDTVYKGTLTYKQRQKDRTGMLYLINYLGHGVTSKVYRAITQSGHGCVVKVYVPFDSEHDDMDDDEFEKFSKDFSTKEVANYKNIYRNSELDGYVWKEKLNNLHCVIMPFFESVEPEQQTSEIVMNAIHERLQQFGTAKMMFKKSDQSWRHVGYFRNQIFLFDLGFLIDIDKLSSDSEDDDVYGSDIENPKAVEGEKDIQCFIADHMARLKKRAGASNERA